LSSEIKPFQLPKKRLTLTFFPNKLFSEPFSENAAPQISKSDRQRIRRRRIHGQRETVMAARIYYHSGTGNSLWISRRIAAGLGGADVLPMSVAGDGKVTAGSGAVGLVFPVHMWGVPALVLRFTEKLNETRPEYLFAVAVNAGQVSNTLVQLKKILARNGLHLSSGFEIVMPSNYIPWGSPGPTEKWSRLFDAAGEKMSRICDAVKGKTKMPVEKGPLWQRMLFTALYHMSFSRMPKMDTGFRADEKCDQCGICAKVCPVSNITLEDGKPVWNHGCLQCLACLQWCPKEAIQYGRKTHAYERYHHPEVQLKDMLQQPLRG
jgi:ferredoxin